MSEAGADKSTAGKVALAAVVAAAGAGIGLLFTERPKRVRGALPDIQGLFDDLKGRVEAVTGGGAAQESGQARGDRDEFADRRRERRERRERRRQKTTT